MTGKLGVFKRVTVASVIFLSIFAVGIIGNAVPGETAEVGSVTAVVTEEVVAIEGLPADEGPARWHSHFPEHPETYVPMPIPEPTEPVMVTQPESRLVSFNMVTGEEVISEIPEKAGPLTAWVKGSRGGRAKSGVSEEQPSPLNFSDLSLISNPEDYPWCVNVKLYMSFASGNYVGSGVLIDPLHVLTAGHCVHDVLNGGTWASSIVVVPGYENGVRPYGDASAVQLHSWTGWTNDANWDHDMGMIDLDRPVGALTGWHGYGYNNDDSFFTSTANTFYNPGYPAESPYNGQYMYWWYGYFDDAYTYQVKFNKRSYGGQSGSGAHHIDSGNRYVYAELSNGTSTWTRDVRITSTKFGHIRDSFIADDTPSTFDLIPLDVNASPGTVTAGNQLSSMDYIVHNYSSASWSDTVSVTVYLSTNDNISTSDTPLQTHYFTYSFGPKSSVLVNVSSPPTIPADTSGGNYWIGVILNVSDFNTVNNDSDGQDATPITVTPTSTIAYSPTSFSFTAVEGGSNPANQTLGIWNSGGDTLNWSVSDNATWLSLSPTSGSSTGETDNVTVSVNISGLSAAPHNATITISASGASNTPQTVPVTLTISAAQAFGDTIGVFRPSQAKFYLRNSNTSGYQDIAPFCYGIPGDTPIAGDWDGDGIDTIGIFRSSQAKFYLRNSNTSGYQDIAPFCYGIPGDTPIAGDWD
ncbi:hypothetical protein CEE34_08920, partial [Candidatus Aerophobetes bacterium Ae_b3a]